MRKIFAGVRWLSLAVAALCGVSSCGSESPSSCDTAAPSSSALLAGEWDEAYVLPGLNGESPGVLATALGPDGVLYAGGFVSHAGATKARNVAAWTEDAGWMALGDGVEGAVTAMAVAPDGALWVSTSNFSSDFTSYHTLVHRWDGAWEEIARVELPEGVPEPHRSGIQRMRFDSAGDLIVAGEFTSIDGVALSHLAVLRGTTWSAIGLPPDAPVYALSVEGDEICAGGLFASIGGVSASRVACWDGAQWTPREPRGPGDGRRGARACPRPRRGPLRGRYLRAERSLHQRRGKHRAVGWCRVAAHRARAGHLGQALAAEHAGAGARHGVGGRRAPRRRHVRERRRHQLRRRARNRGAAPRELPARVELLDGSRRRDPRRGRRLRRRQRLLNFEHRRSRVRGRNLLLGRRDDGVQRGTARRRVVGVAHDARGGRFRR